MKQEELARRRKARAKLREGDPVPALREFARTAQAAAEAMRAFAAAWVPPKEPR